jgi:hypothetical protein
MGHPQVRWSTPVMTQDGGMPAQFQGDREGFEALPQNAMECVFFRCHDKRLENGLCPVSIGALAFSVKTRNFGR